MVKHHMHSQSNETKTLVVICFTVLAMIGEIVYGYLTHSMALLADGYHMFTHALALSLTYGAYVLIRKFQHSPLFPSGTEKIGTLTAYTSSLFLGLTGFWIVFEAIHRIFNPLNIRFDEAIVVAIIGLVVNGVCIFIMHKKPHHHEHSHAREDYNFKAAYFHILADVVTSILAIIALFAGKYFNLLFLDALIGILGGFMILKWSFALLKSTVAELVDMQLIAK